MSQPVPSAVDGRLWIDGAAVEAADGATYDDVDPASGAVFAQIARGGRRGRRACRRRGATRV